MWWQALPALAIVGICANVNYFTAPLVHYLMSGRATMRAISACTFKDTHLQNAFKRDVDLVGNNWDSQGLDYLPE